MIEQASAAQRLLVQGILASTIQLVRCLHDGQDAAQLRGLMSERRRMLGELESGPRGPVSGGSLQALRAAVAESDRTMEALLA